MTHGFGCGLVRQVAVVPAHGASGGDGCVFHDAEKLRRQITLQIPAKSLSCDFRYGLGRHERLSRNGCLIRSRSRGYEPAFDLNTNCKVLLSLLPTVIFWLTVPSFSCHAEIV